MTKKPFIYFLSCTILMFACMQSGAQTVIPLYPDAIPNSKPTANTEHSDYEKDSILIVSEVSRPTLTIFRPANGKAIGTAVIICPGGGYHILAAAHEGTDVARRFMDSGITAFVVKYRLPNDTTMIRKEIGPLQDAQQAMLVVRTRAAEWGIDPHRIGIMGFSAGGHLASTAGTHYKNSVISNPKNFSLRPDFMILIYPVISFTDSIGHRGSRDNLLGPNPAPQKIIGYSNELQVTGQTPPAFLVHAKDDSVVNFNNTVQFALALKTHHVPVEVFLYDKGGHGFGMKNRLDTQDWMQFCFRWLEKEHFLRP